MAVMDQIVTPAQAIQPDTARPRRRPGPAVSVVSHGVTHVGHVRTANQDSFGVSADGGLLVVADGMGGHLGGEVASSKTVEVVLDRVAPLDAADARGSLTTAVFAANAAVHAASKKDRNLSGMGTTVVVAAVYTSAAGEARLAVVHAGDSRCYLIRDGELKRLTVDHSLFEDLVARGVVDRSDWDRFQRKNVITSAVGTHDTVTVSADDFEVLPGDHLLLCSDGLHGLVDDEDVLALILRAPDVAAAATALVDAALGAGGDDNVTVVVARVDPVRRTTRGRKKPRPRAGARPTSSTP